MSLYLHKSKPNLIELKLLKHYNNKIKNKYTIIDEPKPNIEKNYYLDTLNIIKNTLINYIWQCMKEYYGVIIFILLMILLLYIRYIEVSKRKKKLKKILFS